MTPTLSSYTEERYLRELRAIKGLAQGDIDTCLSYARKEDALVFTGYNSSFVGGCIAYCPACDCIRVNDGPDSYAYHCRTCGTSTSKRSGLVMAPILANELVKVKPLVWRHDAIAQDHYAVFGHAWPYQIKERGGYVYLVIRDFPADWSRYEISTGFPTVDEAKAAAQSEWNDFIRSALPP